MALAFFCSPRSVLIGRQFPFVMIGLLGACSRRIREVGKVVLDSGPLGSDRSAIVLRSRIRSPCECNFPQAPTHGRGSVEGRLVFVIVIPQAFFDKME